MENTSQTHLETTNQKADESKVSFIEEKRLVATYISGRPRPGSLSTSALVTLFIVLTSVIYWALPESTASLLVASKQIVFVHGEWWRLLTAVFIHSDPAHLLSNLLLLSIFGFFIYGYFGIRLFPFIPFMLAAVANGLTVASYDPSTTLLGASGLVYVMGAFWLTLYLFVQRQYRISQRLIRVLGLSLMLFAPTTFVPTTSYTAHAWGFFFGVLSGVVYFFWNKEKIRRHEVYKTTVITI